MTCPKCSSANVNTQIVSDISIKNKHHGIFWWICIGSWWVPLKWLLFTLPALIFAIFFRRKKIVTTQKTMCICQACGHTWEIR